MPDLVSTITLLLALGVWAGGARLAIEIICGRREPAPDVLSGLAQRNRTDFVRMGREATAEEIRRQVKQAEPAMPADSPVDLDFHFHNRAN